MLPEEKKRGEDAHLGPGLLPRIPPQARDFLPPPSVVYQIRGGSERIKKQLLIYACHIPGLESASMCTENQIHSALIHKHRNIIDVKIISFEPQASFSVVIPFYREGGETQIRHIQPFKKILPQISIVSWAWC